MHRESTTDRRKTRTPNSWQSFGGSGSGKNYEKKERTPRSEVQGNSDESKHHDEKRKILEESSRSNARPDKNNSELIRSSRKCANMRTKKIVVRSSDFNSHTMKPRTMVQNLDSRNSQSSVSMTKQLHTGNLIDYDILDYQFKNLQRTEGSSCNSQHNVNSNEKKPLTICNSVFDYEKPSPRGLTRDKESIEKCARKMQPSNNRSMSMIGNPSKIQLNQISEPDASKYNEIKQIPDTMKIEVRRTVVREGGIHFEETSIIQFPKNLPPNVQIITAQFVPGNHDQ